MNKELNIPICRAKKKDSVEYIVEQFYYESIGGLDMLGGEHAYEIDKSTLAIHFPGMIDSDGVKIFASLSEDFKGSSIINGRNENQYIIRVEKGTPICYHRNIRGVDQGYQRWGNLQRFYDVDMRNIFNSMKAAGIQE